MCYGEFKNKTKQTKSIVLDLKELAAVSARA